MSTKGGENWKIDNKPKTTLPLVLIAMKGPSRECKELAEGTGKTSDEKHLVPSPCQKESFYHHRKKQ